MDDTLSNVLEGTRQYFMGVPKPVQGEGGGQPLWPNGIPPLEEGAPAQSGAPAPSSRPPSAAAAPPSTPGPPQQDVPPRPPSEPLEPEPHIIHKATVMREALEKRREQPEPDEEDDVEAAEALSPPSHIIRKPSISVPSPAPAPAVPSPSPARPPSAAPQPPPAQEPTLEQPVYRPPSNHIQTPTSRPPDPYTTGRPPDPYTASRPPETYSRYHYETHLTESGRTPHVPMSIPAQNPTMPRHSPHQTQQNYGRMSNTVPVHATARLRDNVASSIPAQRYAMPASQPPPHNDRVPPIHHPSTIPSTPCVAPADSHQMQAYPSPLRRESSPYDRNSLHFERHQSMTATRKYDPQQAYPGYRPTPPVPQTMAHRMEPQRHLSYKQPSVENSGHYVGGHARPLERPIAAPHPHETTRMSRIDYAGVNRNAVEARSNYLYPSPSTSTSRYTPSASVPTVQSTTLPPRSAYRAAPAPKPAYDYNNVNHVQTSPVRAAVKPGFANQQSRMTVSVTAIVNQMNQTKQKRESPLDLSVKTVKNSADSSTTQDDVIDSATVENKSVSVQQRPSSTRHVSTSGTNYVSSLKVDFAPDFYSQYRERNNHNYNQAVAAAPPQARFNNTYEPPRPAPEPYIVDTRQQIYPDRSKYSVHGHTPKNNYVPQIDLTRPSHDDRYQDRRTREVVSEDRKRPNGPIVSNIPDKIMRYETWTSDSRIEKVNRSVREQQELMARPVYSYSSHKQFEAYQNEQRNPAPPSVYRDPVPHNSSNRYLYPAESTNRVPADYHNHYIDRNSNSNIARHVIQKIPNHREISHHHHLEHLNSVPADKRVLSILRNSLETKQTVHIEPTNPPQPIPDLIVIDDADDSVIEITDLTKDNETENTKTLITSKPIQASPILNHNIQMPKAIDSIPPDSEYNRQNNIVDTSGKSPENDVASRIRTKAELKVLPPSQENTPKTETRSDNLSEVEKVKPKSQKQHLFNQIREDNLRLESVIKTEHKSELALTDLKTEPMNIEEIEKDAELSIKLEQTAELEPMEINEQPPCDDTDWASACDNFMEQLKSGAHKKKPRKRVVDNEIENKTVNVLVENATESAIIKPPQTLQTETTKQPEPVVTIKQEPLDEDEIPIEVCKATADSEISVETIPVEEKKEKVNNKKQKDSEKQSKSKSKTKEKEKNSEDLVNGKNETVSANISIKKEKDLIKTVIKEELESTDDDEPLIKSKLLKQKEESKRMNYQLLKDLSEKSAYVKLECFDVEISKNHRKSIDSFILSNEKETQQKSKLTRQNSRAKGKFTSTEKQEDKEIVKDIIVRDDSSSDSDDDVSVASRLRLRKSVKAEEKSPPNNNNKTPIKGTPSKKQECSSNSSTPVRKPAFGDGSNFHPGWEEELYKYKRSLRMPTRLIAIPRGRSGGPFVRGTGPIFTRGSTSLPDLDPAPLSPAPSSAPSAATDDFYARRQDKLNLDSDLESNSSCSAPNRLHYDSEASTSTVFSSRIKKKGSSIVDVLMQKCGKKEDTKKKSKEKTKDKETPKIIPKNSNELLPTPGLGLVKNGSKGVLSAKKEKLMEDIFYFGAFRKETVSNFRNTFINNTGGLIGATEEFAPTVLKSRTRTESRVLKQRATIREVFGDERPASAPPTSCRDEGNDDEDTPVEIKKEPESNKMKQKTKKIVRDKIMRRSSSIRDGLRSTKSLKRNDANGRLMRLKKRNNIIQSLSNKRLKLKEVCTNKQKKDKSPTPEDKSKESPKEETPSPEQPQVNKKRFKRLFGRRKFSSGFDYIRKKKKIIRREEGAGKKIRRQGVKPNPESVHDIQKEIKGWFVNKSIGETPLHRAARLGYTDCVAYCLEKMAAEPSAKDNAGFTPLHVAAAKGHVRIGKLLLQYGANVSAAAQGGIRPLHEASENNHVEMIRLLLSYGADPLLGTYAGQTPVELAEGNAGKLLRLHIMDVQGQAIEPWVFPSPAQIIDTDDLGCDPLSSPPPATPPPPPDSTMEIQCTEAPLPPFYTLKSAPGQPTEGLWCLLQDITSLLQIKSKESLLKQIHCGSGSPKELLREIRTQEFLERAQCHQLLCAGEKVNVRASKVALVRVTDKLRQLLKIETVLIS